MGYHRTAADPTNRLIHRRRHKRSRETRSISHSKDLPPLSDADGNRCSDKGGKRGGRKEGRKGTEENSGERERERGDCSPDSCARLKLKRESYSHFRSSPPPSLSHSHTHPLELRVFFSCRFWRVAFVVPHAAVLTPPPPPRDPLGAIAPLCCLAASPPLCPRRCSSFPSLFLPLSLQSRNFRPLR